jgi:hypothetical protein
MSMLRNGLFALLAFPAAAAGAQTAVGAPSPDALALAHLLRTGPLFAVLRDDDETAVRSIKENLLNTWAAWRGAPCDRANEQCQAAAEHIAREVAPKLVAERRATAEQARAILIEDKMSPQAIRTTVSFLSTEDGKAFGSVLEAMIDPTTASKSAQERLASLALKPTTLFEGLTDRFYNATAKLPRAPLRSVPASPPPPPPPVPRSSQ